MGIILTNDCELDKDNMKVIQVCPVVSMADLGARQQFDDIRRNKLFRYFYLPEDVELGLSESVVDFRTATTIDKSAAGNARRLCTLTDLGRQGFYAQYIRYLTRWQLSEVHCPACESEFNLSMSLPVRAKD